MTSLLSTDREPAMTDRQKNRALLLLAMTQFVIVIDASIVNVALPSIGSHLHFSQDDLTWVVNAYTLTFAGFLHVGRPNAADLLRPTPDLHSRTHRLHRLAVADRRPGSERGHG